MQRPLSRWKNMLHFAVGAHACHSVPRTLLSSAMWKRQLVSGHESWQASSLGTDKAHNLSRTKLLRRRLVTTSPRRNDQLPGPNIVFRQMIEKESSTYTYLLGDLRDPEKPAALIDPVDLTAARDAKIVKELGLNLKYALNTHVHADHVTGTYNLRAKFPGMLSVLSRASGGKADLLVEEGDTITLGGLQLEVISTPGHTEGCVSYLLRGPFVKPLVFTGDAVLIRGCGRTDFQQGDPRKLYRAVWEKIFSLAPETAIYPAHDYHGLMSSTVAEEMANNARLTKSEAEFVDIMNNLNLPYPKKIDASVPLNMVDGRSPSDDTDEGP